MLLETARLRLRPLTSDDAALVFELLNEPAWLRFIGDRGVRTLDDAGRYLANGPLAMYARHGFGLWCVEERGDGSPVGLCGLIKRESLADVDLGFAYLERHWGRGFGYEAGAAALDYGLRVLKLPRIIALTAPDNERSGRLLEKLGFRFDRMSEPAGDLPVSRIYVR